MKRIVLAAALCVVALAAAAWSGENRSQADIYGPGTAKVKIRFFNGLICTMESGADPIPGELWIDGNRVTYAGAAVPTDIVFDAEIDLKGDLLLPGFKNAHAHSPMVLMRSYADGLPLDRWLNEMIFPVEAKLTAEDIYHLYKLAVLEYVSGGITAAFDMYFKDDLLPRAAVETGFRAAFCGSVNNFNGSIEDMEQAFLRCADYNGLVKFRLGFHAEYTASPKLLADVAALSKKYGAPVSFHNSETAKEVEECVARYAMTPTAFADSLGLLDHGGTVFHCVHLTDEDRDIIKARGLYVATCPASNCKLASGVAEIGKLVEKGIPVAIGTDGPSSNNALDMFREMYLLSMLQKVALGDSAAMDPALVLRMATVEGARAMGFADCDSLAPGKIADLVVISLREPNMRPINHVINNLVYAGGKRDVRLTMIDGRIVYENGRYYVGTDPEDIYQAVDKVWERLIK